MSSKEIRRDQGMQSSVSTRTRSKSINFDASTIDSSTIDSSINENSKRQKNKRQLAVANTESIQNNKSLSPDLKAEINENNGRSSVKRVKKLDKLLYNKNKSNGPTGKDIMDSDKTVDSPFIGLSVSKTPERLQSQKRTYSAKISFYASKLKNSPAASSLTSRRSTKTPKKSPKNLSSPKTHSISPKRLSKSPRKLTLTDSIDSPTETEKKNVSLKNNDSQVKSCDPGVDLSMSSSLSKWDTSLRFMTASGKKSKIMKRVSSVGKNNTSLKTNDSKKKSIHSNVDLSMSSSLSKQNTSLRSMTSPAKKSKIMKSVSSVSMKHGIRRFSKSPKIVLRSPKSRSKSKSKPKRSKSLNSTSLSVDSLPRIGENKVSASKKTKSAARRKSDGDKANFSNVSSSKLATAAAAAKRLSLTKDAFALKEPIVVLQRLSNGISIGSPSLSVSLMETHAKAHFSGVYQSTPRLPSVTKSDLPRKRTKSNDRKMNDLERSSKSQEIAKDKTLGIDEFENSYKTPSQPLMSSTPRNRGQRTDKHETARAAEIRNNDLGSSKSDAMDCRKEINVTIEKEQAEGENGKDETYELLEPKTPLLRKRLEKKQSVDEENANKKATKKSLKVRFMNISSDMNASYGLRLRTSCDGKEEIGNLSNVASKTKLKKNAAKSPISVFRRRSNSLSSGPSRTVVPFVPSSRFYQKSNSITNINVVSTPPFVSPLKKPESKYSASKKVPNFAEIHKKMFAKSESVVEARKRLEERHTALTVSKANNSSRTKINPKRESQLPSEPCNGPYNRFGFKIRKNDATECIVRKTNVISIRNKQQQQNRAVLKGVRMNRRFELQMKARNMKH